MLFKNEGLLHANLHTVRCANGDIQIFDPSGTFDIATPEIDTHSAFLLQHISDSTDALQKFIRGYFGVQPLIPERKAQSLNRYGFNIEVLRQLIPNGGTWVDLGAFGHDALRVKQIKPLRCCRLFSRTGGALGMTDSGMHYWVDGMNGEPLVIERLDLETDRLPIETGIIDVVSAFDIIEHFKFSPEMFIMECNRVLKPGGTLIVSTPNITSAKSLARMIEGESPYECREYHRAFVDGRIHPLEYDYSQIYTLFVCNGFEARSLVSIAYTPLTAKEITAARLCQKFYDAFPEAQRHVHPGAYWFFVLRKQQSISSFNYCSAVFEIG
jgi:SAM-dependent methyltransferase